MTASAATAPRPSNVVSDAARALQRIWPALAVSKILALVPIAIASAVQTHQVFEAAELTRRLSFWDGAHYLAIAADGYPCCQVSYHDAFLPGFPLALHIVGLLLRSDVIAALVINVVAEAVALALLWCLVSRERDESSARFGVWLVALAPFGFFLSGVYTESLFLAGAIAAVYLARRGSLSGACIATALACATRITGVALLPFLIWEWWRRGHRDPAVFAGLLVVAVAPLLITFLYFQIHVGDFFAFHAAQTSPQFHHDVAPPWEGFFAAWNTATGTTDPYLRSVFAREVISGVVGALLCVGAWFTRRFPSSFALYCTCVWLLSTSVTFWLSVGRYELAMFPLVLLVALWTERTRWLRPVIVVASAGLMVWGAFTYAQGLWLA